VTIYDPPNRVRYEDADTSFIQFDLEELDENRTRLTFLQHFVKGSGTEESDWPGGDQPAGPDTPWKPGFVGGFHAFLDQLGLYLDGEWTRADVQPMIDAVYASRDGGEVWAEIPTTRSTANSPERHAELVGIYRDHIKETYPR
jgi:hypothetical protein